MTENQLNLLKSLAMGKISELRFGIHSIDGAVNSQRVSDEEKSMLIMQRGQLSSALQDLEQSYTAVEQEDIAVADCEEVPVRNG